MPEKVECPTCGKVCGSASALTAHTKKEHGDDPFASLAKEFGDAAPKPGGAHREDRPLSAAPSGIPSIDYAIGIGGVPRGTIIEVFGPPASGKTFTALTFSAYAQQNGGKAGYVDAEHALQPTFAQLIPGLDLDKLFYSSPRGGEAALNISKGYIETGMFDVWTVDSVHACVPEALVNKPIGSDTVAELAKLMSTGCQVLDFIIAETNTVCIFVNHVKVKPMVQYGKDWFKPGGSALDYYASVQLKVTPTKVHRDSGGRKLGHTVKIRVEKSKVAAPFAEAEYDLYYYEGKIVDSKDAQYNGMEVTPGIDLGSSWFSVCDEASIIRGAGGRYYDMETGESLGFKRDVIEMLETDCDLRRKAEEIVYGQYAKKVVAA